jgi:hypothetical protein
MAGTYPVAGDETLDQLSDTLTTHESLRREQLTGLVADTGGTGKRNLATFENRTQDAGSLTVVKAGATSSGTKIFAKKSIYVQGVLTDVDVYRMDD